LALCAWHARLRGQFHVFVAARFWHVAAMHPSHAHGRTRIFGSGDDAH